MHAIVDRAVRGGDQMDGWICASRLVSINRVVEEERKRTKKQCWTKKKMEMKLVVEQTNKHNVKYVK